MCQIQIIKRFMKKKNNSLSTADIKSFFDLLSYGSYTNADAYGFFTKNYMYRKAEQFSKETPQVVGGLTSAILQKNASFLVGHNRLATKGSESKNFNNHPFPSKDWLVVHNGVLQNDSALQQEYHLEYKEETDSVIVVKLLQKFYDEGVSAVDCIKKVAEELQGSFSICAYNSKEDRLFYFKNDGTEFSFRLFSMSDGSEVLVGSTDSDNFDKIYTNNYMIFSTALYDTFYETEAFAGCVYEITDRSIEVIDYFKPKERQTYAGSRCYERGYSNNSPKQTHTIVGGVYDDSWEDWQEFDKKRYSAKDIATADDMGQLVPYDKLGLKEDIDEYTVTLTNELEERTGISWDYNVNWKDGEVSLFTRDDAEHNPSELARVIKDVIGCSPITTSFKNHETNYVITMEDLVEVYK